MRPLCAQDIRYSVPSLTDKSTEAVLLKQVTGVLEPGQMTALVRERDYAYRWLYAACRLSHARADGPLRQRQDHAAGRAVRPQDGAPFFALKRIRPRGL